MLATVADHIRPAPAGDRRPARTLQIRGAARRCLLLARDGRLRRLRERFAAGGHVVVLGAGGSARRLPLRRSVRSRSKRDRPHPLPNERSSAARSASSTATFTLSTAWSCCWAMRSRSSRVTAPSAACAPVPGGALTATSRDRMGVAPRVDLAATRFTDRQRGRRRRAVAHQRRKRVRSRRRGKCLASVLRAANRVEHWANARNQGPAAARAMLGQAISYERIRTSSPISTTSAWSTPATRPSGTKSCSA